MYCNIYITPMTNSKVENNSFIGKVTPASVDDAQEQSQLS